MYGGLVGLSDYAAVTIAQVGAEERGLGAVAIDLLLRTFDVLCVSDRISTICPAFDRSENASGQNQ
jgi:hypothetical protein